MIRARRFLSILTAALIIAQTGCAGKTASETGNGIFGIAVAAEPVSRQSFYFDTICSISIYDMKEMTEENAEAVIGDAFALCQHYESILSRTKEGTDVYNINHAGGNWVECDADTVEVIQKGIDYSELSSGKFDITVGKLSDLWDFHAENPVVPKEDDVKEALDTVNYHAIEIRGSSVRLTNLHAEIDLGGIAKGYIADRVSDELKSHGVTSAIISLGGNIECIGGKQDGTFTIGIEKPYSNGSEIVGTVSVKDGTVVTSGVYERYFEYDGKKYHHILNASTGWPAQTDVVGVTIQADSGKSVDCDALATICLLLGEEEGMKMIEKSDGFEAMFITEDGRMECSSGMLVEFK